MNLTDMPQDSTGFVWWGFNAAILIIAWFIKRDLGEIKIDTKANRELQESNAAEIREHRAICEERHKRLDYEIVEIKEKAKA